MRALVPMGPVMPPAWTPEIDATARAYALEVFPQEAAGIVVGGAFEPLNNESETAEDDVRLSEADLVRVADAEVFFHSHPNAPGSPSAHDMTYQQQLGIPFVILALPDPDLFAFGDPLTPAPLIGRGFRHGVQDCYGLMRDWWRERGVDLVDYPRDWQWWLKGLDLYLENFEAAGFRRIDPATAQLEGDVLLFNFNAKVPMHGGLVMPGGLMLHHAAGVKAVDPTRLSAMVPRSRYQPHISMALRRAHAA